MADLTTTGTVARGLLIPDWRITLASIWDAESSYDTASSVAGVPVPDRDTDMVLRATGPQTDGGSVQVMAQEGGFPGPDGARYVWKNTADAATAWRGWNPPNSAAVWESFAFESGAVNGFGNPHAVTLPDDTVVVAADQLDGLDRYVVAFVRSTAGTWTGPVYIDQWVDGTAANNRFPGLLLLPSGRLCCYYFDRDPVNDIVNVSMSYSDDGGATWAIGQRGCLPASWDTDGTPEYTPGRVRVAYKDGQYLMLVWLTVSGSGGTYPELLLQYASDNGVRFSLIAQPDEETPEQSAGYPDVVVSGGRFHVGYITALASTAASEGRVRSFANAFSSMWSASVTDLGEIHGEAGAGNTLTEGSLTLCVDDDGTVYVAGTDASGGDIALYQTVDHGLTWTGFLTPFNTSTTSSRLARFSATMQRCRMVLVHNWESSAAGGNSLGALYFGGYTTVTLPAITQFGRVTDRHSWRQCSIAIDLPTVHGWTDPGSTGVLALAGAAARYAQATCDAGETVTRDLLIAGPVTEDDGVMCRLALAPQGGADSVAVLFDDGGTASYEAKIVATPTLLIFSDGIAATPIGSSQVIAGAAGIEVLIALRGTSAAAWWRPMTTSEDATWTFIATTTALTDGGGGALAGPNTARIRRSFTSSSGTHTSRWHYAYATGGATITDTLAEGQTNPDDLFGRTFSPSRVYVEDSVRIQTVDGPAFRGDTWTIASRSAVAVHNILPSVAPSPEVGWRSLTTTHSMDIAFDLDVDGEEGSFFENAAIGLYLDRHNVSSVAVQISATGAAWSSLGTVDTRIAVSYTATGNAIVTTNETEGPYVQPDEFVGGYFQYEDGTIRKIVRNTEGVLGVLPETNRAVRIYVEGHDGTEDAAGAGYIWPPRVLIVFWLREATASRRGIKITLRPGNTTPAPPEGYYQIGAAALGPMEFFGQQYEHGRQRSLEPNVDVVENRTGARRSRRLGRARRIVQVSWPNGVDMTEISGSDAAPDHYTDGAIDDPLPLSIRYSTPEHLMGVVDQLDGPHRLVVYCASVALEADDGPVVHRLGRAGGAIYGRITSPVDLEAFLGDELESEVARIGPLVIEEEL